MDTISWQTILLIIGAFTLAYSAVIGVFTGILGFSLKKWIATVTKSVDNVRVLFDFKIGSVVDSVKSMEKVVDKVEKAFEKQINELKKDTKDDIAELRENDREIFHKIDAIKCNGGSPDTKKIKISGKKCLIVDDEKYKGDLVKEYLKKINIKADVCTSIDKSFHLIKNNYDFLVLDWFLNGRKNRTAKEIVNKCINNNLYINGTGKSFPYYKILMYSGQNQTVEHIKGVEFIDFPFGATPEEISSNLENKIEGFFRYDHSS